MVKRRWPSELVRVSLSGSMPKSGSAGSSSRTARRRAGATDIGSPATLDRTPPPAPAPLVQPAAAAPRRLSCREVDRGRGLRDQPVNPLVADHPHHLTRLAPEL